MRPSRHLLLVEDEPTLQRILGSVLGDAGHRVDAVGTAEQALERLEDARAPEIDLVLADKNLPGESGLVLLQRVRALELASQHPIAFVVVTGYPSRDSALEALAADADGYLVKPFRSLTHAVEEIHAVLRAPLAERRRAAQLARDVLAVVHAPAPEALRGVRVLLHLPDNTAQRVRVRLDESNATLVDAVDDERRSPLVLVTSGVAEAVAFAALHPSASIAVLSDGLSRDDVVTLMRIGGAALDERPLLELA